MKQAEFTRKFKDEFEFQKAVEVFWFLGFLVTVLLHSFTSEPQFTIPLAPMPVLPTSGTHEWSSIFRDLFKSERDQPFEVVNRYTDVASGLLQ